MHIGITIGYGLSGSGSTIYALGLVKPFLDNGHKVRLFCHETRVEYLERFGSLEYLEGNKNVRVKVSPKFYIYSIIPDIIPVLYSRPELQRTKKLLTCLESEWDNYIDTVCDCIKKVNLLNRIDAFYVNHLSLQLLVAKKLYYQFNIPYNLIIHGTGIEYGIKKSRELKEKLMAGLNNVQNIIVLNQQLKERFISQYPEYEYKCTLIPPGICDEKFIFKQQSGENKIISYVGRISFDKGLHCLLIAIPLIRKSVPDVKFVIAGDGPDFEALHACWQELCLGNVKEVLNRCQLYIKNNRDSELASQLLTPLEKFCDLVFQEVIDYPSLTPVDIVQWKGEQSRREILDIYQEATFCVLTSIVAEAHPLVIIESLMSGKPIIGTDYAGIKFILDQVEAECVDMTYRTKISNVSSMFIVDMIDKCINLLNDPIKRSTSKQLRSFAKNTYSWKSIQKLLLETLINKSSQGKGYEKVYGDNFGRG